MAVMRTVRPSRTPRLRLAGRRRVEGQRAQPDAGGREHRASFEGRVRAGLLCGRGKFCRAVRVP